MFFESACNRTGGNKYETDQNRNLRTRPRSRRMVERICWEKVSKHFPSISICHWKEQILINWP